MRKQSYLKRNWKLLLNVITLILLCLLVYAIRDQIVDTFNNLHKVNLWVIAVMVPIQVVNYHAQTKMYQGLFGAVGDKFRYWPVWRIAVELNFVNHVFPSGGVSGISYFGIRLRRADIAGAKSTLVQIMKLAFLFVSFEILLVAGLLFMAIGGRVNDVVMLVSGSISTLLVVGTFAFVYIFGSERRIHATFLSTTRLLNRITGIFRPGKPDAINTARAEYAVREFHHNYKLIKTNNSALKQTLWWALVANASEILSVYVVYVAFGKWVNLGSVILAYGVANFAGLVSVMPGGVGIYEALMTGVLAAAGIPAALSLPVTVMYRVINTVIQIPLGYGFYHQTIRSSGVTEEMQIGRSRQRRGHE